MFGTSCFVSNPLYTNRGRLPNITAMNRPVALALVAKGEGFVVEVLASSPTLRKAKPGF